MTAKEWFIEHWENRDLQMAISTVLIFSLGLLIWATNWEAARTCELACTASGFDEMAFSSLPWDSTNGCSCSHFNSTLAARGCASNFERMGSNWTGYGVLPLVK